MINWIIFNLKHANKNGWEPFVIQQGDDVIRKPESIMYKGRWIYKGSVSELVPNGLQMTFLDAVALSQQRWCIKNQTGTRPDLFKEYETQQINEINQVGNIILLRIVSRL